MAAPLQGQDGADYDEDLDQIDFNNYKGMFYNDDPGQKFQDEVTGAHFEYHDMCKRLQRKQKEGQRTSHTIEEESSEGMQEKANNNNKGLNVRALKVLQDLLAPGKPKESRNISQALPQQGYGTTGAFCKNPINARADVRNFRQFSSQFGPQQDGSSKHCKILIQGSNRSKSTDKQRPFLGPAGKISRMPPLKSPSKKKGFLDLQRNIEKLLEERTRRLPDFKAKASEGASGKKSADFTKSRNVAAPMKSQGKKRSEDGVERQAAIYRTTIGNLIGRKVGIPADIPSEQMKKLKMSLIGVEGVAHQSRNGVVERRTMKDVSKGDRALLQQLLPPHKAQAHRNYVSKRVYVSSFLRQSAGIKK